MTRDSAIKLTKWGIRNAIRQRTSRALQKVREAAREGFRSTTLHGVPPGQMEHIASNLRRRGFEVKTYEGAHEINVRW